MATPNEKNICLPTCGRLTWVALLLVIILILMGYVTSRLESVS